ncbi:DUF1287 domain-containing protein [Pontiellaceae bacterium B1224]|nr:DUF1287 domain-containing protein [Pontiellaceae bacterium B1224]
MYIQSCVIFILIAVSLLSGCGGSPPDSPPPSQPAAPQEPVQSKPVSPIVTAAREQIGITVFYDPAYVGLAYPGGDIPRDRGVCTDVVIRALRDALQLDLQKEVHEDMSRAFSKYPANWGLKKPDKNIDHRRVPNLITFFKRRGCGLAISKSPADYLPGDIVTCSVGNRPHIMIVSDRKTADGTPLVIHNIGSGTREENRLFDFPITGHFRIKL